jgi:hypothetical protein
VLLLLLWSLIASIASTSIASISIASTGIASTSIAGDLHWLVQRTSNLAGAEDLHRNLIKVLGSQSRTTLRLVLVLLLLVLLRLVLLLLVLLLQARAEDLPPGLCRGPPKLVVGQDLHWHLIKVPGGPGWPIH